MVTQREILIIQELTIVFKVSKFPLVAVLCFAQRKFDEVRFEFFTHHAIQLSSKRYLAAALPLFVCLKDFRNDLANDVLPYIDTPVKLADSVVHNALAEVAARLKRIPAMGARGADTVACALWDRVGVVVDVRDGDVRSETPRWRRWKWQVQARRGKTLAG